MFIFPFFPGTVPTLICGWKVARPVPFDIMHRSRIPPWFFPTVWTETSRACRQPRVSTCPPRPGTGQERPRAPGNTVYTAPFAAEEVGASTGKEAGGRGSGNGKCCVDRGPRPGCRRRLLGPCTQHPGVVSGSPGPRSSANARQGELETCGASPGGCDQVPPGNSRVSSLS